MRMEPWYVTLFSCYRLFSYYHFPPSITNTFVVVVSTVPCFAGDSERWSAPLALNASSADAGSCVVDVQLVEQVMAEQPERLVDIAFHFPGENGRPGFSPAPAGLPACA